jgi:PAS domain S-box-containing protein
MPKARANRSIKPELSREARTPAAVENHFQALFDAAPDAILEVDSRGRIVAVNASIQELFGYEPSEILGQPVEILIPEEVRPVHGQHRTAYAANPTKRPMGSNLDLQARRKDGSRFAADIVLSPIRLGPGKIHTAAVIRDVTQNKKAETALKDASQVAEAANRAKSEFLASMSHELRSPLNTIMGYTQLLLEESVGALNEKQRRFLGHVAKDSGHLLSLINDILDLSKIEAGQLELVLDSYPLQPLLNEVIAMTRQRAVEKNVRLESGEYPDAVVFGDYLRTKQVLINLLSNALKFTPSGGRVVIQITQMEHQVAISVTDTGIGIPVEHHRSIFDRFHQVGSTIKGVKEGTGLGLAITKSLVEQMGGRIWVESEIDKGSRFTFTLEGRLSPLQGRTKVLVVEDEPLAAQLIQDYLSPEHYHVTRCDSVESATNSIHAQIPDVIILDLLMPGRSADGLDLLRHLKESKETRKIPVIVVSVMEKEASPAILLGAEAHLMKPINKQRLLRALREVIPSEDHPPSR